MVRSAPCRSKEKPKTYDRVTFLQELVDDDQRFERHHLVRQHRLDADPVPDGHRGLIIPRVDDTFFERKKKHVELQKEKKEKQGSVRKERGEDERKKGDKLRTCFCLGALSSPDVAFLI